MTTETTAAPSIDYCTAVLAVLNTLVRARPGTLHLDGGGRDRALLTFSDDGGDLITTPKWIIDALESGWHVRVTPAMMSRDGLEPVSVAALYARFRPRVEFDRDRGFHVPEPEVEKIREALGAFLPPAYVVDALGEVVALYPLATPLHDMPLARSLQRRLAAHLGAAAEPDVVEMAAPAQGHGPEFAETRSRKLAADDPGAYISIAGKCRDAGGDPPWVRIIPGDTERAYTLDEIDAALTPTPPPTDTTKKRGARP